LLRFLAVAPNAGTGSFWRFVLAPESPGGITGRMLQGLKRRARQGLLGFASRGRNVSGADWLVQVEAPQGACCRSVADGKAHSLVITPHLSDAELALHREGVWAVVAQADQMPLRVNSCARVLRLGGLAAETDPAGWLTHTARRMQPGGRLVLQVFDCSSWGFLLCGSRWVGLEADAAAYAYRAEDLEVLLELCGMRVTRRSHHFPWMNALVWASSLFPGLHRAVQTPARQQPDDQGRETGRAPGPMATLLYLGAVTMLLPLALLESLCHAGSVMMMEAERKH
jgi:hypothetical protein